MNFAETMASLAALTGDATEQQLVDARTEDLWDGFVKTMVVEHTPQVAKATDNIERATQPFMPAIALLSLYIVAARIGRSSPDLINLWEMDAAMTRVAFEIAGMIAPPLEPPA